MTVRLPRPDGGYGCVVADPPWSFRDAGSRVAPDAAVRRGGRDRRVIYQTMPLEWICALPVKAVAARSSHLYLWCPSTLLRSHGFPVLDAWGFDYKTTLVWRKLTRSGRPAFGAGHWFRGAHELLLFGVRGRCPARSRSERSVFDGVVGPHSRKPEELQDAAERVSPGPYLELFARRPRPGWVVWGNEADGRRAA